MKKIIAFMMAVGMIGFMAPVNVLAESIDDTGFNPICEDLSDEQKALVGCQTVDKGDFTSTLQQIINVIISIVGIFAVLMLVLAGQKYITSAGDPQKIKQAKDAILYAVIGIIVASLAWAIVNFVVSNIK